MDKKVKIEKTPIFTLSGDNLNAYVKMLIRLVKGGRLNKYYPDSNNLCNLFSFFIPENNHGLYDSLQINCDTGLPGEKAITRVIVDRDIAPKTIKEDSLEKLRQKVQQNPSEVNVRRLKRLLYHRDLLKKSLPALMNLQLKLRSVDTDKYIAYFNAEIDRFDMTSQMFTRYTMVVGQKEAHWTQKQQVLLVGDQLKYTRKFRNLLSEYTINEAEFAFVLLNDLEDVTVEEVQRCQIGPLYFKGVRIPEGMEEIFEKHPDAFILSFPSDRASIHIKEDKNNDPLVRMYRDTLDEENRELRDKKAEKLCYHVYKERKFACTRKALKDFRKFLREKGARCVVYGV